MNQQLALVSLANYLNHQKEQVLPNRIIHIAKRCLIDTLGVALAGSQHLAVRKARCALSTGGKGAHFIGCREQSSSATAALVNATAAHVLDFDDNCYAGFVHGSAVIVPAALAMAETLNVTGKELLKAIALASECQYRVGMLLDNELYYQGWWTTGILGTIGACAAAATLLQLNAEQSACAFGIAVASSCGMKNIFGTDCKSLMAGIAAQKGITAAILAKEGLSGPTDALEHPSGLINLCNNGHSNPDQFKIDTQTWCLEEVGVDIKRIPLCLSSHAAVDALLHLKHQHHLTVEQIQRIDCDVPQIVVTNLIYDKPQTAQQAQFSLPFAIAQSCLSDTITLDHLCDENLQCEQLNSLMAQVSYTSSSQWDLAQMAKEAPEGAEVTVHLKDGTSYSHFVAKARGAASVPLDDEEISAKFSQCAQGVLSQNNIHKLLDDLWHIEAINTRELANYWEHCYE
ncbi:MmgE/PrpD family protein [Celerinatantimonas sp. MCCC 1A17872]|uniref:MmgE/PrpD family protein n=1 Tax=Celerinatantimonas sp. MCCC 1A17872 TaxID=3177514 RepID=UPI0038C14CF9